MNRQITYTVVADGGTDRLLVPIIDWTIHRLDPTLDILEPEFEKRRGSVGEYFDSYTPTGLIAEHCRGQRCRALLVDELSRSAFRETTTPMIIQD